MFKTMLKDIVYSVRRLCVRKKNSAIVLVYHSVGRNGLRFTVTPEMFEHQMAWLNKEKFNVVSLDKLTGYMDAGSIPPKTLAITFDDGYRDNIIEAFPVLKRYGFPATIFLTVSDLGKSRDVRGVPLEILSEEELRHLESSGLVSIEPHTVTHPKLTQVSDAVIEQEIVQSKKLIDGILNKNCTHFAYPKGRYNKTVTDLISKTGICYAYTTKFGSVMPGSLPYELPRNGISSDTTLIQFKAIALFGCVNRYTLFDRPQS